MECNAVVVVFVVVVAAQGSSPKTKHQTHAKAKQSVAQHNTDLCAYLTDASVHNPTKQQWNLCKVKALDIIGALSRINVTLER